MEHRSARYGRPRAVAVLVALLGTAALVTPLARPASADPLSSDRAQAAQLAQRINSEQLAVENLSNQFDAAQLHLQQVQQQVKTAQQSLTGDQQQVSAVRQALTKEAVNAYTSGGFIQSPTASPTANLNPMVASSYFEVATGNQADTVDRYHLAERTLATQQVTLQQTEGEANQAVVTLASRKSAAAAAQAQASATLNGLNGQIATLVVQQQQQAQQQLRAQQVAAYNAQLAQQKKAATVAHIASVSSGSGLTPTATQATQAPATTAGENAGTSSTNAPTTQQQTTTPEQTTAPAQTVAPTTTPPTTVAPAVPSQSGAAGTAVSVALAQVGKPYEYGAAGPGSFDCSGLVTFAYGAAGIGLPHYTGAQWADTTQIPLADAQPGDLIFFNGLGHVGIYLGGGMMVDAPHTGAFVRVEPIFGFGSIDGATRVG